MECTDAADALGVDGVERREGAVRDGGDERELVRRVDPVHVEVGGRLRVAERLGLGEHVVEGAAGLLHRREDEVARAVQDAGGVGDVVRRDALLERLDAGDAAADGGLPSWPHGSV